MRKITVILALACAVQGSVTGLWPAGAAETKSFAAQPGDTLAINSDFGKILIRGGDSSNIEIKSQKNESRQAQKGAIEVASQRSGSTIFVYSFFSGNPGESVDFDIRVPKFVNVVIWGTNPEVDIAGIRGFVRVQDLTGHITAEDLFSSASLTTDRGNISYRANAQPEGDVRLESTAGNVRCELANRLNLRGWIRAGGTLTWDKDAPIRATSVEKQLGTFGPLLYAASLNGNVEVRLGGGSGELSGPAATVGDAAGKATESAREASVAPGPRRLPVDATPEPREVPREQTQRDGQQPVTAQGTYAVKVNVDSVFLNVSVRDRNANRSVSGLQKDDFRVYEDGVEQRIDQFQPSEAPFNLLLLIDVSGSTQSYLHLMKQAAIEFTHQIKSNDRVAVATFNSSVYLEQGFTSDRSAAERAINRIRSGGGTAFYDALMTSLDSYMRDVEGRSAIVVFTDGVDNQLEGRGGSRTLYPDLYRRVQESDTIIYTIFLDTEGRIPAITRGPTRGGIGGGYPRRGGYPGSYPLPIPLPIPMPNPTPYPNPNPNPYPSPYPGGQRDERAIYEEARNQLQEIADQTGGRMYSPQRAEELSGVYSQVADDLRIQYQLGYNSTNLARDGRWRNIRVVVDGHPEAVVRTRKGYYAHRDTNP